jgi:hypothetical protein
LRTRLARLARLSRASASFNQRADAEVATAELRAHLLASLRAVGCPALAPGPLSAATLEWSARQPRQPEVSREEAIAALRSLTCRPWRPEWHDETRGERSDG